MVTIAERIQADLKDAMRSRDKLRLETLRSVVSAFNYRRIEAGADLSDDDQVAVVQKLVKQRGDAITEYGKAGRAELVEKESAEQEILRAYLPAQKSPEEIRAAVREALASLPAEGRNQGSLMKIVMPRLRGVADGNAVRAIVAEELGS